jgi:hypothetical protein
MSTLLNPEMYTGTRVQTIAGLFQDEVTDTNPESRKNTLAAIQQTSRQADTGALRELPMFFLNTDVIELAPAAAAAQKAPIEFDVIRI